MTSLLRPVLTIIVLVLNLAISLDGLPSRPITSQQQLNLAVDEPLFLTPYIESNRLDEARKLSQVKNLGFNLTSYSGFFTVDEKYDSNMFFWFFPAMSGKADTPILLWLQGGPGSSSLFGLFAEMGPLVVDSRGEPSFRNFSWTEEFAMLYIENPVGTGYSFTRNDAGYSRNEVEVAENLYKTLEQFFTVFHEYQKNPFFLTGESYAGKYVPAIGYKIHKMGDQARSKMNLQGMAIGGALCDDEQWPPWPQWRDYLVDYCLFLNKSKTRQSIHVGQLPFADFSAVVSGHLLEQENHTVKPWIQELLDSEYRMLFYSGDQDITVLPSSVENMLESLHWKRADEFKSAPPTIYRADPKDPGAISGHVRQAHNLYYMLIKGAGHYLPRDQPMVSLDLIRRFVRKQPFSSS